MVARWNTEVENVQLCQSAPWRLVKKVELHLHSFLTSTPDMTSSGEIHAAVALPSTPAVNKSGTHWDLLNPREPVTRFGRREKVLPLQGYEPRWIIAVTLSDVYTSDVVLCTLHDKLCHCWTSSTTVLLSVLRKDDCVLLSLVSDERM